MWCLWTRARRELGKTECLVCHRCRRRGRDYLRSQCPEQGKSHASKSRKAIDHSDQNSVKAEILLCAKWHYACYYSGILILRPAIYWYHSIWVYDLIKDERQSAWAAFEQSIDVLDSSVSQPIAVPLPFCADDLTSTLCTISLLFTSGTLLVLSLFKRLQITACSAFWKVLASWQWMG